MKLSYNEVLLQKIFIDKLSQGIDPTSDIYFMEDTILNNRVIKDLFKDIRASLDELLIYLEEGEAHNNKWAQKESFNCSKTSVASVNLMSQPITISKLAFIINEALGDSRMKKLRATQLTEWLEIEGYLETVGDVENLRKIPTEAGIELGIKKIEKKNSIGKIYSANLYSENAQKFVIDNLPKICEFHTI